MKKSIRTVALLLIPVVTVPAVAFAAAAGEVWSEHCARCHGEDGAGNTKVGKKLKVKDYTKADVQAKMTDEEIVKIVTNGAVENGKERMPAYKEKLSEKEIKDLVGHVRSLKK